MIEPFDFDRLSHDLRLTAEEIAVWRSADKVTRDWCRDASDILAVIDGCWFDPSAGSWPVWWIERYCRLYEGEWAGDPMRLRGLHSIPLDWDIPDEFDGKLMLKRARKHAAGVLAGEPTDWQYEFFMRWGGWQRQSKRWGRPVRRFRRVSFWAAKKNKKSPSLAALGIYLTAGDGEQGQKTFLAAKDGTQARNIAGEHGKAMIQQSPELQEEFAINLNKMRFTHGPTMSFMEPLSSGNARHQEGKEGLNGSTLVDETHVVDKAFIQRISRAGISRAEPLHGEFSTAGNNPDGYGKEQFDYAVTVARGVDKGGKRVVDHEILVMVYAAPQDITAEQVKADPVRYGKMANPAWGHTIDDEEFLADFRRSQKSPSEFAEFMMYRLNVWQFGENVWIKTTDWEAAQLDATIEDFDGRPCILTLDKSKSRDMTSIAATFEDKGDTHAWRWDERNNLSLCLFCGETTEQREPPATDCPDSKQYTQFNWFWLPESTAIEQRDKAPFMDWADAGELTLIPGEVIQDGYLKRALRDLAAQFEIQKLGFDQTYAEDITQWAEVELGIERISVDQSSAAMSEPIDAFERLLSLGLIKHGQNRVLDWQARNASIKTNHRGQQVLVKPAGKDDVRKIDGIVADVMGIAVILRYPTVASFYEDNDVEFF